MTAPKLDQKRVLILHVVVPDVYVDDLEDLTDIWLDVIDGDTGLAARSAAMGDLVTEEIFHHNAALTVLTIPGEKCLNDERDLISYNVRIVGAETQERTAR